MIPTTSQRRLACRSDGPSVRKQIRIADGDTEAGEHGCPRTRVCHVSRGDESAGDVSRSGGGTGNAYVYVSPYLLLLFWYDLTC